ncbi:MAG: hypothetical protein EBR09_12895 [Proteobacteria bacterium]|nr:hypothetical protein [Pseudomonadota bacterium]
MNRLANILAAWNILRKIPAPTDPLDPNYANDRLLIKILNPLWNTFFQSNFIVQKNTDTTPAAADVAILKRAFMALPIKNIIGTDAIADSGDSLPPDTRVAGGGGGIPTAGKSAACK